MTDHRREGPTEPAAALPRASVGGSGDIGGAERAAAREHRTGPPRVMADRSDERDVRANDAIGRIGAALRGLRFGTVTAVVQDGVVVQVERTEKVRLDRRDPRRAP